MERPGGRDVGGRAADQAGRGFGVDVELPERRGKPVPGRLAHRFLAGPVMQEAPPTRVVAEGRQGRGLAGGEELPGQPVGADLPIGALDVHADPQFLARGMRDADQREFVRVGDVEIDGRDVSKLGPAAPAALNGHRVGADVEQRPQQPAQDAAADDVTGAQKLGSEAGGTRVLGGRQVGGEWSESRHGCVQPEPPQRDASSGSRQRHRLARGKRFQGIAGSSELVYAHARPRPSPTSGPDRAPRFRFMRFFLNLLTRLPLPLGYAVGWIVYALAYYVFRWRRELAAKNLRNAFPDKSESERALILQQSYRNLGAMIGEAFHGFGADADEMRRRVRIDNPDVITQCTARGQSVILLAAHFCNWEWLLLGAGAQLALPIDAVYKPQHVVSIDRFLRTARARFGGNPIPIKNFLFEIMKRKNEVRVYALLADQTPLHNEEKHWAHFLHQDTAFYVGADKIARILKAPVVYVAMRRERRGHYVAHLTMLAEPPYDREGGTWIIDRYARALEAEIRASPADWLWIHRKWKYPKPMYA
jgi:Kdo2-lipid IVA lauroyltransferase/acyltransferase